MRKRLGCLSPAGIVAAAVALAVVALVVLLTGGRIFSPGPLNATTGSLPLGGVTSHAEIGGRCAACHVAPWSSSSMSDRCLACHTAVADQLNEPASLHGVLQAELGLLVCRQCHPEHRGAAGLLTLVDEGVFPHDAVGFSLAGHGRTAAGEPFLCRDCHGDDLTTLDPTVCLVCHLEIDPTYMADHRAAFGSACVACHDGVDTYGDDFDHDRLPFPLPGQHASVACTECHAGARTPADLRQAPGDCNACHQEDDAHDGLFGSACEECHTPESWRAATFDRFHQFPIDHGVRVASPCRTCHPDQLLAYTCYGCHEHDPAEVREEHLKEGITDLQDCVRCHPTGLEDEAKERDD